MADKKELSWFGTFRVTTEADVEGRYTTDLGTYTGYVDVIAGHLADKVYYSLEFTPVDPVVTFSKPKTSHVSIGFSSGSNGYRKDHNFFNDLIRDQHREHLVRAEKGTFFNSVELNFTGQKTMETVRKEALAKLSDEEKTALGL